MHIRFMRREDIPGVVDVALDAYSDDSLFASLAPRSKQYPISWRAFNLSDFMHHFLSPDSKVITCVTDLNDDFYDYDKGEEIMGYASFDFWHMSKNVDRKQLIEWKNPNEGWGLQLDRFLHRLPWWWNDLTLHWFPWTHPTLDAQELIYMQRLPNAWRDLPYCIDASNIAVSARFQRKGVGSMLLRWALGYVKRHDEETGQHTPMVLHASSKGFGLYKKLGYEIVGWAQFTEGGRGNGDPYITPSMIVDPRNVYTDSIDTTNEDGRPLTASWKKAADEKTNE